MLFKNPSLEEVVKRIRSFGEVLMPFNFPIKSTQYEEDVNCLKSNDVVVDGYSLVLFYSKADYTTHYLEILQITGKYTPFLPFSLVCKIGKKFFGDQYLFYVDFLKDGRKIYCWTLFRDRDGKATSALYTNELLNNIYEGLNYNCLKLSNVKFY